MATERILFGKTSTITCKVGPTPLTVTSLTVSIGDKSIGVDNTPTVMKGTAAPGMWNATDFQEIYICKGQNHSLVDKNSQIICTSWVPESCCYRTSFRLIA